MLKNILKKIEEAKHGLTTYGMGLLQAKAYRALKYTTASILEPYRISTVDWALLGVLYSSAEGIRLSDLAQTLGVEAPFVTVRVNYLQKMNLIWQQKMADDKRSKAVYLSKEGRTLVSKIEKELRNKTKFLLHGVPIKDILAYRRVLKSIVDNSIE